MRNIILLPLITLLSVASLTGCSDSIDIEPVDPTINITRMTSMIKGYHTFRARNENDVVGSKYVFERSEDGDLIDVYFLDANSGANVPLEKTPAIIDMVDINPLYTAYTFNQINVQYNGKNYLGDFTLIQDKKSGYLYPLIVNDQPIGLPQRADYTIWNSSTHYSNVADDNNLYLLYGDNESLHKATLVVDHFVINKIFDDNLRDYWVLDNGDIVSKDDADNSITWISEFTGESIYSDNRNNYQPFIHDGELYAIEGTKMLRFEKLALGVGTILTTWKTNGYLPANNSVKRNGYEMQADCSVYYFDQRDPLNPFITPLYTKQQNTSDVSAAGQDALFCVYASAKNNNELPQFIRFNTADLSSLPMTATAGGALDAMERLVVTSDDQLMYYSLKNSTSFNEYYINLVNGLERSKENTTGIVSIIKAQRSPY